MQSKITAEQARSLRAAELEAPTAVGVLFSDNLIPASVLNTGMTVQIPAWPRVLEADHLELLWDSEVVDQFTVTDPTMTFPYEFTLSPSHMTANGRYALSYRVTPDSLGTLYALESHVTIDLSPPNLGNIPDAPEFPPEVVSGGITTEYLSNNDDKVIIKVPTYVGMEADQNVHLIWATSHALPVKTLVQADVDQQYVEIDLPGQLIRDTGEGHLGAYYYLTSRANFDGPRSVENTVDVILTIPPSGLQAPVVPLAEDGLIDLDDATVGVTIEIPPYQNIGADDEVAAKWGNSALALYPMPISGLPAKVTVSRATVVNEGTGDVVVSYHILRNNHPFPDAPTTTVTVDVDVDTAGPVDPDPSTPQNESLAAPDVVGGVSQKLNELLPDDIEADAKVTIPWYGEAQLGEMITVHWGRPGQAIALTPYFIVQDDLDASRFPEILVPAATVSTTPNDSAWPVYYTLSRADGMNPVQSQSQSVNAHMVGPGGVDGLDPAIFPDKNANGWLLLVDVSPDGAKVKVAAYENMQANDKVTLNWVAYDTTSSTPGSEIAGTEYSQSIDVLQSMVGKELNFAVPFDTYIEPIEALPTQQGSASVTYSVNQNAFNFNAPPATVKIDLYPFY